MCEREEEKRSVGYTAKSGRFSYLIFEDYRMLICNNRRVLGQKWVIHCV